MEEDSTKDSVLEMSFFFYLQCGGSQLQTHQNSSVHQLGYSGVGHFQ